MHSYCAKYAKIQTIIELMITFGIIAILTAILIPQVKIFSYKAIRADAMFTLSEINKAQLAYFAANEEFLPAGCAEPEGSCSAPATEINRELGIGLGEYTAKGYHLFLGYHSTWDCPSSDHLGKSCGFGAFLEKDLDHQPVEMEISSSFMNDQIYVFNNFAVGPEIPNDGRPFIHFDDIRNKILGQ